MSYSTTTQQEILKLLRQSPLTMTQLITLSGIKAGYIAMGVRHLQGQQIVTVTELTYSLTDEGRILAEQFAGEWNGHN